MTLTEFQTKINNSDWSEPTKQLYLDNFSKFGNFSLNFIMAMTNNVAGKYQAEKVAPMLIPTESWEDLINNFRDETILSLMANNLAPLDLFVLDALLARIQDIRANSALNAKLSPQVDQVFVLIELYYLYRLPLTHVVHLFHNSIVELAAFIDLPLETQHLIYYKNIDNVNSKEIITLGSAIASASQTVGNDEILINGQPVAPTITNWIKGFIEFALSGQEQSISYKKVQYFTKDKNFLSLSEENKFILTRIINTYVWLNYEVLNEASVKQYREVTRFKWESKILLYLSKLAPQYFTYIPEDVDFDILSLGDTSEPNIMDSLLGTANRNSSVVEPEPINIRNNSRPSSMDSVISEKPKTIQNSLNVDRPVYNPEPQQDNPRPDLLTHDSNKDDTVTKYNADAFRNTDTGLTYDTPKVDKTPDYGLQQESFEQQTSQGSSDSGAVRLASGSKAMQDLDRITRKNGRSGGGIVLDRSSNVQVEELSGNLAKQKLETTEKIKLKLDELRQRKGN